MITREFNLYLHAGHSIPLVINANQYDHGEQWLFTLFNSDGTQYVPSSGAIVGIKSDNLGIINSGSVDSQGRVVINETQQMTAAVGKAVFELVIDDGTHGTANFVVLVEPKPGDNADLSETDISMIEEAIEAASTIKPYGSPLVASTVAGMTDHDKVYVYVGSETGYTSGHWYYYDGNSWEDGGVYNSVAVQTDTTLTLSGVAADAKKTGDEISELKSQITQLEAIPRSVKLAMDNLFTKIMYLADPSSDYATFHAWASAINVLSISAVFEQGDNIIYTHDSLESLRQYLTVTAFYDNGTSANVTAYALSGELTVGTSVITITYEGKTTSFNVAVTQGIPSEYTKVSYITANQSATGNATQYIDTGYAIPSGSAKLEVYEKIRRIPNSDTGTPWSRNGAYGSIYVGWARKANGSYYYSANTMTIEGATPSTTNFDELTAEMNLTSGAWKFSTNNGTEFTGSRSSAPLFGHNIVVLAEHDENANVYNQGFSADLESFKVHIDDILVVDLIPCVRKSDGIAGMYDIVRNNFYPSSGSSNFAYTE